MRAIRFCQASISSGATRSNSAALICSRNTLRDGLAGSHFGHQFYNPLHPVSLRYPTTLHALFPKNHSFAGRPSALPILCAASVH